MSKTKTWLKDHKKQIAIAGIAAGGIALYLVTRNKSVQTATVEAVKTNEEVPETVIETVKEKLPDFSIDAVEQDIDGIKTIRYLVNDLKLGDLGEFGEKIMEKYNRAADEYVDLDFFMKYYAETN